MFLADKLQRLVDDFSVLDDPQEKLTALVDRSKRQPPLPVEDRTDANRIRGCVSVVWLVGEIRAERCYFRSEAESPIVRGLVAFLADFFNGATAAEVATSEIDPLETLDVLRHLSPTRRNGVVAVRKAIRDFARQALTPS